MRLDELEPGSSALITAINRSASASRLAELGLIPGERVKVLQKAPFGEPIKIHVMHYDLCLRRSEAATISIQRDENPA